MLIIYPTPFGAMHMILQATCCSANGSSQVQRWTYNIFMMLLKCHSQGGEAASWGRKFSAWVSEKYYRREYYFLQQRVKRQAQRIARQLSNLQNLYYLLTFLMIELYLTSC